MESSAPAAVQAARSEEMDSPPAEAHVPDCTIWYEYSAEDGVASDTRTKSSVPHLLVVLRSPEEAMAKV